MTKLSEKQMKLIATKTENLRKLGTVDGMPFGKLKLPDFNKLEGGYNKSGSQYIQQLINYEEKYKDLLADVEPPSDKQVEYMLDMRLCPDVDWDEVGVQIKYPVEDNLFRFATRDELEDQLRNVLNKNSISKYIEEYKEVFKEWKSDRATDKQVKYVRLLENQNAGRSIPTEGEWELDKETGEMIFVTRTKKAEELELEAIGMSEDELRQMNQDQISKYIDQLKLQLEDKKSVASAPAEKVDVKLEFEMEMDEEDSIHKVFASRGFDDPDMLTDTFSKVSIKDMIREAYDHGDIDIDKVKDLTRKNDVFQEIIEEIEAELEGEAFMQTLREQYAEMTVKQLKEEAKSLNITIGKKKKAELIEELITC